MPKLIHRVTTLVRKIADLTGDVRLFELADPDDWELPPFTPGAHIDVHLPSGAVRQYSLCGDPTERTRYRIAVRREDEGRGGSLALHREVKAGDVLSVSLPRNHFPLADGGHHVFVAGGIGITPFLPMIFELTRASGSFELHYLSRTPAETPFLDVLTPLAEGGRVHHYFTRTAHPRRPELAGLLDALPGNAQLYCCGPTALMESLREAAGPALAGRLHSESFGDASAGQETEFEVELARSGRIVPVPKGQSILVALRGAGVEVEASCEGGVCLECKTRYVAGTPVHRDLAMKAEDRGEFLTPCVSGCAEKRLVLDL